MYARFLMRRGGFSVATAPMAARCGWSRGVPVRVASVSLSGASAGKPVRVGRPAKLDRQGHLGPSGYAVTPARPDLRVPRAARAPSARQDQQAFRVPKERRVRRDCRGRRAILVHKGSRATQVRRGCRAQPARQGRPAQRAQQGHKGLQDRPGHKGLQDRPGHKGPRGQPGVHASSAPRSRLRSTPHATRLSPRPRPARQAFCSEVEVR